MCAAMQSSASRRGAMLGALRCDHPDIEAFTDAKRTASTLRTFNLSVLVTDGLMDAVAADASWPLVFPDARPGAGCEQVTRGWPGDPAPRACRVHRRVPARALWDRITRAAYDCGDPGVLFIDRMQREDNLAYCERISVTNPCGEVPLPAYGACDLGSLDLTRFVLDPFSPRARLDFESIAAVAAVAVRMLDNVYDVSAFPLPRQAQTASASRRVGIGITGLADALAMLGHDYRGSDGRAVAASAMRTICHAAYRASIALAREKGPFPLFDAQRYTESAFVRALPGDIVADIRRHGIRNSHLTAIAPTGSVSLLAGNVSSGLEPIYALQAQRRVRLAGGERALVLADRAYALFRRRFGDDAPLPPCFVQAAEVSPAQQLAMQAALAPFVDNAISKTINVPADFPFAAFHGIYDEAYRRGLKGCAAFRPNPVTGSILAAAPAAEACPGAAAVA
jgi:ribonucleoside-diphosphate reductase alpha chain